jgi:FkbM family methyltransferase
MTELKKLKENLKQKLKPLVYAFRSSFVQPGSDKRPLAQFDYFLEDLKTRGLSPKLILDVGANAGKWTRMAKLFFPNSSFLLIEPQIEMRQALDTLCKEFSDVHWVEAGAGSQPGKLVQTIWDDLQGSSFMPEVKEELLNSGKQREIEIITIDFLLQSRQLKIPELVKLDIQGFELEALKGANSLFGETEIFILEVSLYRFLPNTPTLKDVITFMDERGYEVYDIPGYLRRPYDGALGQIDIAFAKSNGLLRQSTKWSNMD